MFAPVLNWFGQLMPESGTTALDRKLAACVHDVLTRGTAVANAGDRSGCNRLYEGALLVLRSLLEYRPELQQAIDQGMAAAAAETDANRRLTKLRDVLESLRTALTAPVPKTPRATPPTPGPAAVPPPPIPPGSFAVTSEEYEVIILTNKERAAAGLPPLKLAPKLFLAARIHGVNMARQGKLAHDLDGKQPADRVKDAGYVFQACAENVACGQRTPAEVVAGWMTSPGHRANILSQVAEIGTAVANSPTGVRYWVQVFGTPM